MTWFIGQLGTEAPAGGSKLSRKLIGKRREEKQAEPWRARRGVDPARPREDQGRNPETLGVNDLHADLRAALRIVPRLVSWLGGPRTLSLCGMGRD